MTQTRKSRLCLHIFIDCTSSLLFSLRVLMMQLDCVHGIRVAAFLHFRVGATRSVRRAGCVGQNAKLRIAQVERRQASESRLRRRRGFCVDMFVVISGVTVLAPMLRHTHIHIPIHMHTYIAHHDQLYSTLTEEALEINQNNRVGFGQGYARIEEALEIH